MNRFALLILVGVAVCTMVSAQQPNSPATASLVLNGLDGPPYPINPVNFPRGTNQTVAIRGLPNSAFYVAGSNGLRPAGALLAGYGLLDLDMVGFFPVLDGITNPAFVLSGTGTYDITVPLSATTALNLSRTFQGLVQDFTSPAGATLTAASRIVVVQGITVQNFTLGDDATQQFSLTPFGFTLPYYRGNYSSLFVNSNGSMSFENGDTNYIASSSTFISGPPEIAGFSSDLSPNVGGTIRLTVDQTTSVPFVKLEFINVAEFSTGAPHNFTITQYSIIGDIVVAVSGFNPTPLIPVVIGISPGYSRGTQGPKNMGSLGSAPGVFGGIDENFHEYFPAGGPFDLAGTTLTFYASGAGTTACSYLGTSFP